MPGLEPRALGMLSKRSTNQAELSFVRVTFFPPFAVFKKEKDTFNKSTQTKTEAALWVARFVFQGVSVMGVCGVCVEKNKVVSLELATFSLCRSAHKIVIRRLVRRVTSWSEA